MPGSTVVVVGKVVAVVVVVVGKVVVVVVVVVGKVVVVVVVVVSVGSTVTAMMKASSRNPPTYGLALFTEFKSARSVIDANVPLILIEPQPAEAVAL